MAAKKTFLSNETKIGILAVVAIALLIWGFTYLKGRNILSSSNLMYVEYPKVDMLANSAPVLINGFRVGVVADMYLKESDMRTIVVVLDIKRGVNIPKNTVAEIISTDITGGKGVRLMFDTPCSGEECAQNGDYLQGRVKSLLSSMVSQDELSEYLGQVSGTVGEIWDTLGNRMSDPDAKGLSESIRNFNAITANLNDLILASSRSIQTTMASLSSITGKIDEDNEKISAFLTNVAAFSEQLNKLELDKTLSNLDKTMGGADTTLAELTKTLKTANTALGNISDLVDGLKQGEGTIGQLLTNDSLYHNLNSASQQLEVLLKDFEEKPYRYMPLKNRNKVNRYDRKDAKQSGN
jgi:phospholipid/cholesterol/gamma-HCH transport system substrate-binding protein